LVGSNQGNYFENATTCSKRTLKTTVATQLKRRFFFIIFYNEPEVGAGIDPGMALTPLPSSIGWGSNPRPFDREPSVLIDTILMLTSLQHCF